MEKLIFIVGFMSGIAATVAVIFIASLVNLFFADHEPRQVADEDLDDPFKTETRGW